MAVIVMAAGCAYLLAVDDGSPVVPFAIKCVNRFRHQKHSVDFFERKKQFVLKKHWLAHTKSTCPRCHIPFRKGKLGRTARRSFYCGRCQKRYPKEAAA